LDWSDIVEKYNIPMAKDTVRKACSASLYGCVFVTEYLKQCKENGTDFNNSNINEELVALDIKKREIQKERAKLQATKIEYNRNNRQDDRFELFYENVRDAIQVYPTPEFTYEPNKQSKNKEYILTLADIHCGAKFTSQNNSYSIAECTTRFNILFSQMVDYVQEHDISTLHIVCLGDCIQNILRLSDLQLNETSVVEAVVTVSKLIAGFLNDLSCHCYIEYYHTPSSNHSQVRPIGSKANELVSEDLEYVIGNYIKDVLANNPRVHINTNYGKEFIEIPIYNLNIIALHGHQLNSLSNAIRDLSMLNKKFFDICLTAHQHSSTEMVVGEGFSNDVELLLCPSFIGSDPYSDKLMRGSKAACKIFVFNEKYGHVGTDKIILN
jgi:predicted phosphodiesterase